MEIALRQLHLKDDEIRQILYAFRRLLPLKVAFYPGMEEDGRAIFFKDHEEYAQTMNWLNDLMRSNGYEEPIFRDIGDYKICAEDYNFYYELKTEEQLIEEEAKRKNAAK